MTHFERLKDLWKKYGYVAIGTYGGVYVGTLALLYGLVSAGAVDSKTAIRLLEWTHLDQLFDIKEVNPRAGNFALAWLLTKFTEPLRFAFTVTVTPPLARVLGLAPKLEGTVRSRMANRVEAVKEGAQKVAEGAQAVAESAQEVVKERTKKQEKK